MDENSNALYLQRRKTYLSQPPRPNHHLPHGHHVANDKPPQQKNLIMTKSQMIGRLKGLVTEVNKIVTRKRGLNCDPLKIILKLKSDSQVVYLEWLS